MAGKSRFYSAGTGHRHASSLARASLMTTALLALAMLVLAPRGSASASPSDDRQKRDEIRQHQIEVAAQLDGMQASDDELEQAVALLDANAKRQQGRLADAQRALDDARHRVDDLSASIGVQEQEAGDLAAVVSRQAVARYVNPSGVIDTTALLFQAKDPGEGSRRKALADSVQAKDRDALDRLRAVRAALVAERSEMDRAAAQAQQLANDEADQLKAVQSALADQQRLRVELDARIAEFHDESNSLASEDARLSELIRQSDEAERARQEAARRNAASGAGRAGSGSGSGNAAASGPGAVTAGTSSGAPGDRRVVWPINGSVSSEFGYRWGALHPGIDIAAPEGTPIGAAKAGTVISAGWAGGYGNLVVIDHGGGFATAYGHQSRIAATVGQVVTQGQIIGYVGTTGNSTGNHLHFECRVDGVAQNPRNFL
jgi:septal ring factor EnvC (AmiA/AmiB activator)